MTRVKYVLPRHSHTVCGKTYKFFLRRKAEIGVLEINILKLGKFYMFIENVVWSQTDKQFFYMYKTDILKYIEDIHTVY